MTDVVFGDVLGPRGRRKVAIASTISGIVALVLGVLAVRRLADKGVLDADKWSYFVNANVAKFLARGALATVKVAVVAMFLSVVIGGVLALGRLSRPRPARLLAGTYVELFRALPLLLLIFYAGRALPKLGLSLSPFWYLVIGLTAYNAAVLAEIFRAGILSLDRGQSEAAYAIGLTYGEAMRSVIVPQAVRRMVPSIISQLITLLKDTSLGFVLPFEELLRRGQIAGEEGRNILQALVIVAAIYITVNASLAALANVIARRQDHRAAPVTGATAPEAVADPV
jgi:glutamate transport system permease protein